MGASIKLNKVKNLSSNDIVFAVSRATQKSELFLGSSDAKLYSVNLDSEKPERVPFDESKHTSYITSLISTQSALISCSYDRQLCWWDPEKKASIRTVKAHDKWIRRIEVSPDQKFIASVADDMQCKIWNAESGDLIKTLSGHKKMTPNHYPSMLYCVAWSSDGKRLATADKTGIINIWDVASGAITQTLEAPVMYTWDPRARRHSIGGIRSVAFSPDGKTIAVGGIGKIGNIDHLGGKARLEIFDIESGDRLHEIESNDVKGLVERIQYSKDGSRMFSFGGDHKGFIFVHDAQTGEPLLEEKCDTHIHDFVIDDTEETLVTVGHNRVTSWSIESKT